MNKSKHINKGFTLIELLVVFTIIAVLIAVTYPSANRMFATHKINNRAQQLQALFQFARSEAVRTNKPSIICATKIRDKVGTSNTCVNFSDYNEGLGWQGFMAFTDKDSSGDYDAKSTDNIIKVVAINQNINSEDDINKNSIGIKVKMSCKRCDKKDYDKGDNKIGFMPAGGIAIGSANYVGDYSYSSKGWVVGKVDHIIIELYDKKYENITSRIIINSSGSTTVCNGHNSNEINLCKTELK